MNSLQAGRCRLFVSTAAVCMLLMLVAGHAIAASEEERCEQELDEANELYLDRDFTGALGVLADCYYRDDLSAELSIEIARLVSLAYINKNDLDAARRAVLRILSFDPDYEADAIQDPPTYASMVSIVRRQVRAGELDVPETVAEERRSLDWLYIVGGGVITVAITTVFAVMADRDNGSGLEAHEWPSQKP